MEDKDFLSYFWDISQLPNKQLKLTAAKNIVQTLLTVENIKKSGNRKLSGDPATLETAIMKKYRNEDYGKNVSEDLNYTLSRLVQQLVLPVRSKDCLRTIIQPKKDSISLSPWCSPRSAR